MYFLSLLSLDQLAHILSLVPVKQRLASCSLVSSTWRTAAARATTNIAVYNCKPSFGQWLLAHSAQVNVSQLSVLSGSDTDVLKLPVAHLQHLESLELYGTRWSPGRATAGAALPSLQAVASAGSSGGSSSSLQPLAALTALTQLTLGSHSVKLAGLSALTGLQELFCAGESPACQYSRRFGMPWHWPANTASEADLIAALPQLQRLTSLTLHVDIASTFVAAQLSALQSLQQLELFLGAVDGLALPPSLTQLRLMFLLPSSLTASNAAGLSQLSALQSLHLRYVKDVDWALLAGMRDLHSLRLHHVEFASSLTGLTALTGLTGLNVGGCQWCWRFITAPSITAAEAGALTSSSQLVELALCDPRAQLQPQAYASLFPPRRQLPYLTKLVVSADLLSNPATVRQAGSCCPNLQGLRLGSSSASVLTRWEADEAATVAESLAAMSDWSSLRVLSLDQLWINLPTPLWQALGTLSQLTSLYICVLCKEDYENPAPEGRRLRLWNSWSFAGARACLRGAWSWRAWS
jgi:hypothetical protein